MKIVKLSGSQSNQSIDPSSPLYVHPSDGPRTVELESKLNGSSNYRTWRRDMELSLAAKRKLGFIKGGIISWLVHSVSESIKQSIMFTNSAQQIWKNLEVRFSLTDGVRKYSLNRQVFQTTQHGRSIVEFYTDLSVIWEELEALNDTPPLSEIDP
ncbi:hypothetical protein RDABS01_023217 [Bienertia sinuspersici]